MYCLDGGKRGLQGGEWGVGDLMRRCTDLAHGLVLGPVTALALGTACECENAEACMARYNYNQETKRCGFLYDTSGGAGQPVQ